MLRQTSIFSMSLDFIWLSHPSSLGRCIEIVEGQRRLPIFIYRDRNFARLNAISLYSVASWQTNLLLSCQMRQRFMVQKRSSGSLTSRFIEFWFKIYLLIRKRQTKWALIRATHNFSRDSVEHLQMQHVIPIWHMCYRWQRTSTAITRDINCTRVQVVMNDTEIRDANPR